MWRRVSRGVGGLLVAAAILKLVQLFFFPTAESGWLSSRWFLSGLIQIELAVGVALVSGIHWTLFRRLAIVLFATFVLVTAWKVVRGDSTCGCFGPVDVSPVVTLAVDVVALILLVVWRPPPQLEAAASPARGRPLVLMAWIVVAGVTLAATLLSPAPRRLGLEAEGDAGDFVVVEPEQWVGRPCPLLPYIESDVDMANGTWTVVLYHEDCPKCIRMVQTLGEEVHEGKVKGAVLLVRVPPYSRTPSSPTQGGSRLFNYGTLRLGRRWFVQAPATFCLDKGIVVDCALPGKGP